MARSSKPQRVDPTWPQLEDGQHAVTELVAAVPGSLSPYGDEEFPLKNSPYKHPVTVVNR